MPSSEGARIVRVSDLKLSEQVSIALMVVGVGEITAWTLLSNLSEIEYLSRNKIVALEAFAVQDPFEHSIYKSSLKEDPDSGISMRFFRFRF
jgi:hypothetical protein